jgi:hypothetical protein
MAGSLINTYTQLDTDILALQLTSDANFVGKHNISLTNYDTTGVPAIAAGSIVECNGALFEFTADEAVTGTPSNGTVYIQIIPSTTTCTAAFTNTAPTWSDAKQGFYGTGGAANYRYLEFEMTRSSATVYSNKHTFTHDDNVKLDIISTTTANITTANITTADITTADITTANVYNLYSNYGEITTFILPKNHYQGTVTGNNIYDYFVNIVAHSDIPLGKTVMVLGAIKIVASNRIIQILKAIRNSDSIIFSGYDATDVSATFLTIYNGATESYVVNLIY